MGWPQFLGPVTVLSQPRTLLLLYYTPLMPDTPRLLAGYATVTLALPCHVKQVSLSE